MEVWQHIACGEHTHLVTISKYIWLAYRTSRERNLGLKVYTAQQTLFKLRFFPGKNTSSHLKLAGTKTHKQGREKSQTAGDEIIYSSLSSLLWRMLSLRLLWNPAKFFGGNAEYFQC